MSTLSLREEDIRELLEIGSALAAERNLDTLLQRILEKSLHISNADAGSIFLAEGPSPDLPTHLRFKLTQNESISLELREFTIPLNPQSLAGYVAVTRRGILIEDVYELPPGLPFQFNPEFDRTTGYRSKSVLSLPMLDHKDQLIGVMQLWNKKRDPSKKLTPSNAVAEVIPFSDGDHKLLTFLAAQAGVAIENARLYVDIRNLFEGFIRASVTAIEARDPTTSGHSERVARLTIGLAREVHRIDKGPFHNAAFSEEDLQELNYAALLHDFGKIGVRESVLVKAKKLFPEEIENVRYRFDLMHRSLELEYVQRKLDHLSNGGKSGDSGWLQIENELATRLQELTSSYQAVLSSNEPTVLPEAVSNELHRLSSLAVARPDGKSIPLLSADEVRRLSIPKGSLSEEERKEIESHVTHTYQFLRKIPWTREFRRIPEVAYAHHEKLDGSGYPRKIRGHEIPLSSKIMTVADIFDALAARDRPYKKAVPVGKALDILKMEVKDQKLDPELVRLFIDQKVFKITTTEP